MSCEKLLSSSPISQYVAIESHNNPEMALNVINKMISVIVQEALVLIRYFDECLAAIMGNSAADFFRGQHLYDAKNQEKLADLSVYEDFKEYPLMLTEKGQILCKAYEEKKTLVPRRDGGKCQGGVSYFLSEHLSGKDIRTVAQSVEDGIPVPAVIAQSLHSEINRLSPYSSVAANVLLRIYKTAEDNQSYEDFEDFWKSYASLDEKFDLSKCSISDEEMHVYRAVYWYSLKCKGIPFDVSKRELTHGLISFVEDYLARVWNEKLRDMDRAALLDVACAIENKEESRTLYVEEQSISVFDLEVENYLKGPEKILDSISSLEPGDYQLRIPLKFLGVLVAYHTTALVVDQSGFSYLYDPNIGTGWMSPWWNERAETVERLFERYGFERKPNFFSQIVQFSMTLFDINNKSVDYFLYKVRKTAVSI